MTEAETRDPPEVQVANANHKANAALRERDEARADAETLRALLATANAENGRLVDTLRRYDCDDGCGCFKRHCSDDRPCLAHQLDEARVEVAQRDLALLDLRDRLADVARRQREACAQLAADWAIANDYRYGEDAMLFEAVEATPLVTEETP